MPSGSALQRRRASLLVRYSAALVKFTELNRSEAMLALARQEAELAARARTAMWKAQAADRAKGEFVAHMSHELRTPLNAIIGFSDMIRLKLKPDGMPEAAKILDYVNDINAAGWHLYRIISDILDFAKIEAGKLEMQEEPVDFDATLESCFRMLRDRIGERQLVFLQEVAADMPMLMLDDLKFKQILLNLLSNAIKFTLPGGTVRIEAAIDQDRRFVMKVSDTGIGIAAENLPKVLMPFTQVDSMISRKHEGTGLGLPLTKALVELHGGSLDIASTVGVGTTVTIRLPAARVIEDSRETMMAPLPMAALSTVAATAPPATQTF